MVEPTVKVGNIISLSSCDGADRRVRRVVRGQTKEQLALDQIGLSRIRDRSDKANRCSRATADGYFGLRGLFEG